MVSPPHFAVTMWAFYLAIRGVQYSITWFKLATQRENDLFFTFIPFNSRLCIHIGVTLRYKVESENIFLLAENTVQNVSTEVAAR